MDRAPASVSFTPHAMNLLAITTNIPTGLSSLSSVVVSAVNGAPRGF